MAVMISPWGICIRVFRTPIGFVVEDLQFAGLPEFAGHKMGFYQFSVWGFSSTIPAPAASSSGLFLRPRSRAFAVDEVV